MPADARWLAYWRIVVRGRAHLALPTAPAGSTIAGWRACGLRGDEEIATLAGPGEPAVGVISVCSACAAAASSGVHPIPVLAAQVREYRRRRWALRWRRLARRSPCAVPEKPRL